MEKTPMYSVIHPPNNHPTKRSWVVWASAGVGVVALVMAGVLAGMAVRQMDRATMMEGRMAEMEGRMVEMEGHMEELLEFTLASHDYFDYEDDYDEEFLDEDQKNDDSQAGPYEHLTVQRVLKRRRREVNSVETNQAVPIYEQSYGVNLKDRSTSEGLRLYEGLQANQGKGDPRSQAVTIEVTESPIKPYHRISNLWVPKKRPASSLRTRDLGGNGKITRRRSRTKSLHESRTRARPRPKQRPGLSNTSPVSVQYRDTRVKATSPDDGYDVTLNLVVPQPQPQPQPQPAPLPDTPRDRVVVQQGALAYTRPQTGYSPRPATPLTKDNQRKRRNKHGRRRRRRARPVLSLAHFVADNSTRHGQGANQHSWVPAVWMNNLGLTRKYSLDEDTVVVKEAGLYYLYAQVLYESGTYGSGFQILVDDIPVLECAVAPTHPSPSCHTSGTSYLPRHAAVSVRDLDQTTRPIKRHPSTFFGLVKLMDAPDSAEQLLLA